MYVLSQTFPWSREISAKQGEVQLLSEKAGEEEVEKRNWRHGRREKDPEQHASVSPTVDPQLLDVDDTMPMKKRKRARKLVEDYEEDEEHDKEVEDDNNMDANDKDNDNEWDAWDEEEMKMMNKLKQGKEKKKKRISREGHQTEKTAELF